MKIGLRWRWILPLVVLIVFYPASAQDAVVQTPYTCPTETEFRSKTPFTQAQVEDWLGFWHPLLQEVVDMPPYSFSSIPYVDPYFVLKSCSLRGSTFYIGVYIPAVGRPSTVLAFEILEGQITAVRHPFTLMGIPHLSSISAFADRNFNGLPDMAVWARDTGNMSENPLLLLEWQASGMVDITPSVTGGSPNALADIDRDGVPELLDTHLYFIPTQQGASAGVQQLLVWYRWNSIAYEMVAVQVDPFVPSPEMDYIPGISDRYIEDSGLYINDFLNGLSLEQICEWVGLDDRARRPEEGLSARLFQILLYHQTWGRVEEGWTAIESIITVARTCPASAGKSFFFNALDRFATELDNALR